MKCYFNWIVVLILIYRVEIGHCSLQAVFRREEGKYLSNNVIGTKKTESELDCCALCSRESSCVSVNYQMSGENQGLCELNNKTLKDSKEDGKERPEFVNLEIIRRVSFNRKQDSIPILYLFTFCLTVTGIFVSAT